MPNLLSRSATWLGTKLQAAGGRAVVYRRGTKDVAITITPLDLEEVVEETEDVGTEIDNHDWSITASELVLNGETINPQQGDVIEETLNGVEYEYQVLPRAVNKPAWAWLDKGTRTILRVYTKKVKGV